MFFNYFIVPTFYYFIFLVFYFERLETLGQRYAPAFNCNTLDWNFSLLRILNDVQWPTEAQEALAHHPLLYTESRLPCRFGRRVLTGKHNPLLGLSILYPFPFSRDTHQILCLAILYIGLRSMLSIYQNLKHLLGPVPPPKAIWESALFTP